MEQSNETFKNSPHGATTKKSNSTVLTLSIICGILAIALIAFGIMYFNTNSTASRYGNALEASYKKTFYELLDNVNDIDHNSEVFNELNPTSIKDMGRIMKELNARITNADMSLVSTKVRERLV